MPSPSVQFATTVGTTAVKLSDVTGLTALTPAQVLHGVVLSLQSDNPGRTYLKVSPSQPADTTNALLLQNGQCYTLHKAAFGGDLSTVWLIASGSGQAVTGECL